MFSKILLAWLVIAAAETVQGILRVKFLNRPLGDRRARQAAVVSGSLIILALGWLLVPWIKPASTSDCLWIGGTWLALMLAFDLGLGRFVFRFPWKRLAADFIPQKGGWLGIGMLVLFLTPLLVAWCEDLW